MSAVITVLHVIVCFFLVIVVLLQRGKGAQVGAVFGGGGGATMFGGRGAGNFLTKLTTGAAIVFMLTSLSLSYLGITRGSERLFDDGAIEEQTTEPPATDVFKEVEPSPAPPAATAPAPSEAGAGEATPVAPEVPAS